MHTGGEPLSNILSDLNAEIYDAYAALGHRGRTWNTPPFAVVCGGNSEEHGDHPADAIRAYPWGACNMHDPMHSDFLLIKYDIPIAQCMRMGAALLVNWLACMRIVRCQTEWRIARTLSALHMSHDKPSNVMLKCIALYTQVTQANLLESNFFCAGQTQNAIPAPASRLNARTYTVMAQNLIVVFCPFAGR